MKIGEKGVVGGCLKGWPLILGVRAMEGAGVIPGEKLGFYWRTGEGKEEGDGADRRARTVSEGGRALCGREVSGRRQAAAWAVRSWAKREAVGRVRKGNRGSGLG